MIPVFAAFGEEPPTGQKDQTFFRSLNSYEYRNSKHETNPKQECANVQNRRLTPPFVLLI
jgi:hypothetical protein